MTVDILTPEEWATVSENAYITTFLESGRSKLDRIDFTILMSDDKKPVSFCTVREFDSESAYVSHGGMFPGSKGVGIATEMLGMALKTLEKNYKRVTWFVHQTNIPMLKLSFNVGFLITGMKTFKGETYIELSKEFGGQDET